MSLSGTQYEFNKQPSLSYPITLEMGVERGMTQCLLAISIYIITSKSVAKNLRLFFSLFSIFLSGIPLLNQPVIQI